MTLNKLITNSYNSSKPVTQKTLAYFIKHNKITESTFTDYTTVVEVLLNCNMNGELPIKEAVFIINNWKKLTKVSYSKVAHFKKHICAIQHKFTEENYNKLLQYGRGNAYDTKYLQMFHGFTQEEAQNEVVKLKKTTAGTLQAFTNRYGVVEGKKRFDSFSSKSAHTLDTFQAKFGKEEGTEKYEKYLQSKDSNSLKALVKKYGLIDGTYRHKNIVSFIGYRSTVAYFMSKYGAVLGYVKYKKVSKSKGKTADYFTKKYGSKYWGNLRNKKLETLGLPLNYSPTKEFNNYAKKVRKITRLQPLHTLRNFEQRGHMHYKDNAYNLDHKYSIFQCFTDNIPAQVAGHIVNLEFIPMTKNITKGVSCSITKAQLLERYNAYENN